MGNGYTPGRPDDMAQMRALIQGIDRRLSDLERPMGGLRVTLPIAATAFGDSTGSLGVSTTYTTITSATVTVPTGYTKAIVFANAYAQAECSINGDYLYVQCKVDLSGGGGDAQSTGGIPAQSSSGTLYGFNQYPQGNATLSASYSGLAGGSTITASCQIESVTGPWTASAVTGGSVQLQVIFLA